MGIDDREFQTLTGGPKPSWRVRQNLRVEREIKEGLGGIEQAHGVRVLFACESGSRAWGFASPDSDYDVRFIYAHPQDGYLSIEDPKETIEFITSSDLDYAGWDLRKMLRLLRKSNPSLLEWIGTPIVYAEAPGFHRALAEISPAYIDPAKLDHHYASMARNHRRAYLMGERVPRKKYLYVLRPILCRRWIDRFRTMPPVPFSELMAQTVAPDERPALDRLLAEKMAAREMETGPHDPDLDRLIESEIDRPELPSDRPDRSPEMLDRFFREWVG